MSVRPIIHPQYREIEVGGLRFKMTCGACPEQYDVLDGNTKVGYVRLRHGRLTAESPDSGDALLLDTDDFYGDGIFEDPNERGFWLHRIAALLKDYSEYHLTSLRSE